MSKAELIKRGTEIANNCCKDSAEDGNIVCREEDYDKECIAARLRANGSWDEAEIMALMGMLNKTEDYGAISAYYQAHNDHNADDIEALEAAYPWVEKYIQGNNDVNCEKFIEDVATAVGLDIMHTREDVVHYSEHTVPSNCVTYRPVKCKQDGSEYVAVDEPYYCENRKGCIATAYKIVKRYNTYIYDVEGKRGKPVQYILYWAVSKETQYDESHDWTTCQSAEQEVEETRK